MYNIIFYLIDKDMFLKPFPQDWLLPISSQINIEKKLKTLSEFIQSELSLGKKVYPDLENCFLALELVGLAEVKVVILGQDPYHGAGEAHGLAFSVRSGVKAPPSLRNILTELKSDLNLESSSLNSTDLTPWAREGVLLLNSCLTVNEDQPGSHFGHGWEDVTDAVIKVTSEDLRPKVFILWGAKAQAKKNLIDATRHLVIEGPHPSPLSSYRGFFGSKPFSRTNEFLKSKNQKPISWILS